MQSGNTSAQSTQTYSVPPPIKEYPLAKGGNAQIARLQQRDRP